LHRARRMLRDSLGEQLASALKDVFPFDKPRCDALVQRLLDQLGFSRNNAVFAKMVSEYRQR
jgi:hypothetical protein